MILLRSTPEYDAICSAIMTVIQGIVPPPHGIDHNARHGASDPGEERTACQQNQVLFSQEVSLLCLESVQKNLFVQVSDDFSCLEGKEVDGRTDLYAMGILAQI